MKAVQSNQLALRNRQRVRQLDLRLLRPVVLALLDHAGVTGFNLGVYCVGAPEMTRLNENFLRHAGSTDVITFDYAEPALPGFLHGEVFVCIDEAIAQARRFHATWQSELVRYVVHGILHLQGFDDARPARRRVMKREERRRLKWLEGCFELARLSPPRRSRRPLRP